MRIIITHFFAFFILFASLTCFADEPVVVPEKWFELRARVFSEGEEKANLNGVTIPHLISPALAREWGDPSIFVLEDGSYYIRYHNLDPDSPFEMVTILGFATTMPSLASVPDQSFDEFVNGELAAVERPQSWKSVKLAIDRASGGKSKLKLQYFREYAGGGADGPRDATDTFSLTANGMTGRYIVIIDTATDATKKRLKTLSEK